MYEQLNFSGFVVKAAESHFAWFYSLLEMFWAAEESTVIHSIFADGIFIFAVYFDTDIVLGRK